MDYNKTNFTENVGYNVFRIRGKAGAIYNNLVIGCMVQNSNIDDFSYDIYKERTYPISLGNIELNKIGDYKDSIYYEDGDWYLEKNIGMYTFTGTETSIWDNSTPRVCYQNGIIISNDRFPSNTTTMPLIKCNKYITTTINRLYYVTYDNRVNNSITLSHNNNISFRRTKWTDKTMAINDIIGTKFYYVYMNPVKEKITDSTLLSQLNAIRNNNLFDGVNHIYFDSDIDTDISFDYIEE